MVAIKEQQGVSLARELQLLSPQIQVLKNDLERLGVGKIITDMLTALNKTAKLAKHTEDIWTESGHTECDPYAKTLTKYLQRSGLHRAATDGPFTTETVAFEFPIPKKGRRRTAIIRGVEQTFSGDIPNMNDLSDRAKKRQQGFRTAIEAAMGNPKITRDFNGE